MDTAEPVTARPPIPPLDLAAERAELGSALDEAVAAVVASGQYVLGPRVEAFERGMADLCGVAHGVGVASGTDALIVGLKALGVGPGDGVVTSPFTFFASASSIALLGARPQLADVDPETALLEPAAAAAAVDGTTVGVQPVHLYGQMCDVRGWRELCDARGLFLFEDAAQAHGASRGGLRPGELGDAAAFSFYPTKNLGALGEGGLVVTRRDDVAAGLRRLRDHGSPVKYEHAELGWNSRLHAIQAAALLVKLPHLAGWNERRRATAARYDAAFAGSDAVRPLATVAGAVHARHQYTVRIAGGRRDAVQAALAAEGIGAGVHYPRPVHLQEAARPWGYGPGDFPVAERLAAEVLCLPVHPFLAPSDADRVAEAVLRLAAE